MSGIQTVFGTAGLKTQEAQAWFPAALKVLQKHGVSKLDTAQLYVNSEDTLGKNGAASSFVIDTKWRGGFKPKGEPKDVPFECAKASMQRLGTDAVDVYYIHAPPEDLDMEEYLAGINDAHKTGLFKRFGLSNFKAADVQKIHDMCESKGYVLPSVYQGNYSPVARRQEQVLFPTLRKLNMSFFAYSPLAGGLLTKTKKQIEEGAGRFGAGSMYGNMYSRPSYLEALAEWEQAAKDAGCSKAELAYRWVKYNSPLKPEHGDAIIVGASRLEQLEETLQGLEAGPLDEKAVGAINDVWSKIEHEAPLDNYHG